MSSTADTSVRTYAWTLVALLALTAATALVSSLHLRHGATVAALLFATIKASIVLLVFMHMRAGTRVLGAVLALALSLYVALLGLSYLDWGARDSRVESAGAQTSSVLRERGRE